MLADGPFLNDTTLLGRVPEEIRDATRSLKNIRSKLILYSIVVFERAVQADQLMSYLELFTITINHRKFTYTPNHNDRHKFEDLQEPKKL